jgi:3,4-dihydroxy-2-butanone 4-phosphate synthase
MEDEPIYVASRPFPLERKRLVPVSPSVLPEALDVVAAGGIVGLVGIGRVAYFVVAGELVDAEVVARLAREARGLVAVCLLPSDCVRLGLRPIAAGRRTASGEEQHESFEARTGVSTGISAEDRALTIRVACDPSTGPQDITKPGHITPFRCHEGATLEARTLVDAAVDLVRLAGLRPAAAVCTVLDEAGNPLTGAAFADHCRELGFPVVTVDEVVAARVERNAVVSESGRVHVIAPAELDTGRGLGLPQTDTTLSEPLPAVAVRDEELGTIGPDLFREVLGSVCTPVSVVTTMHDGKGHATTVSAFCSLSIDPPLILVALDRGSELLKLVRRSRVFGVNILADQQAAVAAQLARKDPDKLAKVDWVEDAGLPRLLGSAGWLACKVNRIMAGGDHMIVTGLVVRAEHEAREPLLYRRRRFLSVS